MTTKACTVTRPHENVVKFAWAPLTTYDSDPGAPVVEAWDDGVPIPPSFPEYVDRNVQVTGTVGVNFAMVIEGGNDGVNYATLNDATGTALSFTAVGIKQIQEIPPYMRPRITDGEIDVTSVNVIIVARRERSGKGV